MPQGGLEPERILRLEPGRVVLLDQRLLPGEETTLVCRSSREVADAIGSLAVRGAPAIGIAAAMGYALAAELGENLDEAAKTLTSARPTAVNLSWAIGEMQRAGMDAASLADRARRLHVGEVERCRAMAEHAADLLGAGSRPLTHCNTGALATGGIGTALGAIVAAHRRGVVDHVLVDETRPLLQGSRLTAWELERAGIPHHVIVDGAAGSLMARGMVSHVLVGADRIVANGDVANKIGTYALAVLASYHAIPFIVVAPTSTVDLATGSGSEIPVEQRAGREVTTRFPVLNPAFDVTPAELVTAIVTEDRAYRAPYAGALGAPGGGRP